MDKSIQSHLDFLGLENLKQNWDVYLKEAMVNKCSYQNFLSSIIKDEYHWSIQKKRSTRIKRACIPELLVMETFPFELQPRLKKKLVMELYDSMRYIEESQVLCLVGPTGCGKTGLATSYLLQAIGKEYRGKFFDFKDLLRQLNASLADHSYRRAIKHLASLDCLLLDEVGYAPLDKTQAGIFFELMKSRHGKRCTIITSQLGFDEWETFICDRHLSAAILDRVTENCTVFNMSKCISIRKKHITYAAEKTSA
jgi:DNA replication protein DnaC